MKFRVVLVLFCLLSAHRAAEGLGSLTSEGSVVRKTTYHCVIRSLTEDSRGRLWAGTFGAGLLCLTPEGWVQTGVTASGLPDLRISRILVDSGGLTVATVGGGAARMDFGTDRWNLISGGTGSRHFHALLDLGKGRTLLGSVGEGLFLSSGTAWIRMTESEGLPSDWINDALVASDGILLATAFGIALLREDRVAWVEVPEGEWTDIHVNVLGVFDGDLFLGCGSGGLVRRTAPPLPPSREVRRPEKPRYKRISGVPDQVHSLLEWGGKLWIGTENGLFSMGRDGVAGREKGPLAEIPVKSLGTFRGSIVAGTDLGVIYHLHDVSGWSKIFEYTSADSLGGPHQ